MSTINEKYGSLVKRLRHRPLTAETGVRFPYESPNKTTDRIGGFILSILLLYQLAQKVMIYLK